MDEIKDMDRAVDAVRTAAASPYYTVSQLQAMVGGSKSRNRPALLKKLGLSDVPRPESLPKTGAPTRKAKPPKASRKLNGKRPGKPKPNKADLHATALSYVKRAMARKEPPSLRVLCEEMSAKQVQKPRGGTDWWPSSVQNLMRQAAKAVGGAAK